MITTSESKSIAYAQIIIFAILLLPSLINTRRHGKRGLLGFIPLQTFCILRIVGGALSIQDYDKQGYPSVATGIISGLGLGPLILAGEGILHEARSGRGVAWNKWIEWGCVIQFHLLNVIAVALIASRGKDLANSNRPSSSQAVLDVGVVMLLIAWIILVGWTLVTYLSKRDNGGRSSSRRFEGASILLHAVSVTLPFVGLRVLYALIYYISNSTSFAGSLAARVILDIMPEMVFTLIMCLAGIRTRDMYSGAHFDRAMSMPPYRNGEA